MEKELFKRLTAEREAAIDKFISEGGEWGAKWCDRASYLDIHEVMDTAVKGWKAVSNLECFDKDEYLSDVPEHHHKDFVEGFVIAVVACLAKFETESGRN
jgi:hypothetical protein